MPAGPRICSGTMRAASPRRLSSEVCNLATLVMQGLCPTTVLFRLIIAGSGEHLHANARSQQCSGRDEFVRRSMCKNLRNACLQAVKSGVVWSRQSGNSPAGAGSCRRRFALRLQRRLGRDLVGLGAAAALPWVRATARRPGPAEKVSTF